MSLNPGHGRRDLAAARREEGRLTRRIARDAIGHRVRLTRCAPARVQCAGDEAAAAPAPRTAPVAHRAASRSSSPRARDDGADARALPLPMAARRARCSSSCSSCCVAASGAAPAAACRRSLHVGHRSPDHRDRARRPLARRRDSRRFLRRRAAHDDRLARGSARRGGARRRAISCCPTRLPRDDFRRLRVVLRYGRPSSKRPTRTSGARSRLTGEPCAGVDARAALGLRLRAEQMQIERHERLGRAAAPTRSSPGCVCARSGERIGPGTTALTRRFARLFPFVGERRRPAPRAPAFDAA